MGFFKKIFKGIKKVFKKVGRAVKKVASKVGKFMGKLGIVGQIGMAFILPGIGGWLANTLGNVGTWASAAMQSSNLLVKGAATVVNYASKFAGTVGRVFKTVSDGVTNFMGEFVKTAVNKIPGINIEGAATNFFGDGGAFDVALKETGKTWETTIGSTDWWKKFEAVDKGTATAYAADMPEKLDAIELPESDFTREQLASPAEAYAAEIGEPLTRKPLDDAYDYSMDVIGERVPEESLLSGGRKVSIPTLELPEVKYPEVKQKGFFSRAVSSVGEQFATDPLGTITKAGDTLSVFSQPEYDMTQTSSGGYAVYAPSPETVQRADPLELIKAGTPYGYTQSLYDQIYKPRNVWAGRMA